MHLCAESRHMKPIALMLAVAVLIVSAPQPATAQWPPDSIVNLQVLPEDIAFRELVGIMRGFAGGRFGCLRALSPPW